MRVATWQLDKQVVFLRVVGLNAQLDLQQAANGLSNVVVGGNLWTNAQLLGLTAAPKLMMSQAFDPIAATSADEHANASKANCEFVVKERFIRGNDLVMSFEMADNNSIEIDAVWRIVTPNPGDKFMIAIDWIVSVHTQQLGIKPMLSTRSELSANTNLRLLAADPIQSQTLSRTANTTIGFSPDEGAGCWLFRQLGMHLSYVEMIHPADFCYTELLQGPVGQYHSYIGHKLFSTELEKGVMLRSRLRGVFVPRIDDIRIAAECYAAFAAGDPPLGS
jgi:hypothetical protein